MKKGSLRILSLVLSIALLCGLLPVMGILGSAETTSATELYNGCDLSSFQTTNGSVTVANNVTDDTFGTIDTVTYNKDGSFTFKYEGYTATEANKTYRLSFWAKSTIATSIQPIQYKSDWSDGIGVGTASLTTDWKFFTFTYTHDFVCNRTQFGHTDSGVTAGTVISIAAFSLKEVTDDGNLIKNGHLDEGMTGWGGYTAGGYEAPCLAYDKDLASNVLKIDADGNQKWATWKSNAVAGTAYNVSFKIKGLDANDAIISTSDYYDLCNGLYIRNGDGTNGSQDVTAVGSQTDANGWMNVKLTFTATSAVATSTRINLTPIKGYTVFVDDMVITEVQPEFTGATATLGEDIALNLHINANGKDASALSVTLNESEFTRNMAQTDMTVSVSADNIATVRFPAKNMADTFTATLCVDGTAVDTLTYSVKDYAMSIVKDADDNTDDYTTEAENVAKAMLNYGAWAQTYFNYNTDALANAELGTDAMTADNAAAFYASIVGTSTTDGTATETEPVEYYVGADIGGYHNQDGTGYLNVTNNATDDTFGTIDTIEYVKEDTLGRDMWYPISATTAGKSYVISFWAKANISMSIWPFQASVWEGASSCALTTEWKYFSFTATPSSSLTQINFRAQNSSTAPTAVGTTYSIANFSVKEYVDNGNLYKGGALGTYVDTYYSVVNNVYDSGICLPVDVATAKSEFSNQIVKYDMSAFESGKTYRMSVWAKASAASQKIRPLIWLEATKKYAEFSEVTLSTDWQYFTWTYTAGDGVGSTVQFEPTGTLAADTKLYFADFTFIEVTDDGNLVTNGDFSLGMNSWENVYNGNGEAIINYAGVAYDPTYGVVAHAAVNRAGTTTGNSFEFKNTTFAMEAGKTYDVSFKIKNDATDNAYAWQHVRVGEQYLAQVYALNGEWKEYKVTFTATAADVADGRIQIGGYPRNDTDMTAQPVVNYYFADLMIVEHPDAANDYKPTYDKVLDSFAGYTLIMRDTTTVRLYFTEEVTVEGYTVEVSDEYYVVDVLANVLATGLDDAITVTASNGTDTMTISNLSVLSPAALAAQTSSKANLRNVCTALILYAEAVNAYA